MNKEPTDEELLKTALKVAATPTLRIINDNLYIQGKLLNNFRAKISEIYMQYITDPKKYNPLAKFPEEINALDFTEEVYFPLLHLNMKPFKMVVGMKLENYPEYSIVSKNHIAFQCDNDNCKFRVVSLLHQIQDTICEKCKIGKMKSVDFENTEFKEKD